MTFGGDDRSPDRRADGRMLVSSGADMVLKIWDTRTGDQLRTVQNQFTKEVTSVCFAGDGDLFVASGGDSKVRLVNATNGNNQRDFSGIGFGTLDRALGERFRDRLLDFVLGADADHLEELADAEVERFLIHERLRGHDGAASCIIRQPRFIGAGGLAIRLLLASVFITGNRGSKRG